MFISIYITTTNLKWKEGIHSSNTWAQQLNSTVNQNNESSDLKQRAEEIVKNRSEHKSYSDKIRTMLKLREENPQDSDFLFLSLLQEKAFYIA